MKKSPKIIALTVLAATLSAPSAFAWDWIYKGLSFTLQPVTDATVLVTGSVGTTAGSTSATSNIRRKEAVVAGAPAALDVLQGRPATAPFQEAKGAMESIAREITGNKDFHYTNDRQAAVDIVVLSERLQNESGAE